MLFNLKKSIISHLQNLPGWRTERKIVVIESDDWGSIRMPSRKVFEELKKDGYRVDNDPFMKYDNLASEDDLSGFFEVLTSVKDSKGRPAIITANTIVANPDFARIEETGFLSYFYEPFTETLRRYPAHSNSFNLWKEGITSGVFHPQFHGREHLNVDRWMKALQAGDPVIRRAFSHRMLSISSEPNEMRFGYMEALDHFSPEEKQIKASVVEDGLRLFKRIFGFDSRSFIACCYVWDNEIEKILQSRGVNYIQGVAQQLIPAYDDNRHYFKKALHYIGQSNSFNQIYLTRNAFFEPALLGSGNDHIGYCLNRMSAAFRMKKPAIVASHRLNYIGSIHKENRDHNLILLKKLLSEIVRRWPEVEFMTSDELGGLITKERNSWVKLS